MSNLSSNNPPAAPQKKGSLLWQLSKKFQFAADQLIPDSLVFCLILTFIVFLLALAMTDSGPLDLVSFWYSGLWTQNSFAFLMGIMVVTCATTAKAPQVRRAMTKLARIVRTPTSAMILLMLFGFVSSFLNWAFCTIITPILAMILAKNIKGLHFPMMIAAGYTCMIFGQCLGPTASVYALLATEGHFMQDKLGVLTQDVTVYNPVNVIIWIIMAICLMAISIFTRPPEHEIVEFTATIDDAEINYDVEERITIADKMNGGKIFMYLIGLAGVVVVIKEFATKGFMGALSMNLIILIFIVANCFLYKTPRAFLEAYKDNMKLACEVIVQFPFYGGIMGIMQSSGLAQVIVAAMVSAASARSLPVWSFISACVVNLFIPSQGGQWIVQGPLLIDAAEQLGANPIYIINAFVHGDECTNLLQPLYLIPALSVVGMKLKDAWGYCAFICVFWLIIASLGFYFIPVLL